MPYCALIIDDEELTLRTISRGFRQDGFEVFTALSGEEGLKIFHDENPDLILLDIVLPGIDGVEVLRQIKRSEPDRDRDDDERLPSGGARRRSHEAGSL